MIDGPEGLLYRKCHILKIRGAIDPWERMDVSHGGTHPFFLGLPHSDHHVQSVKHRN